MKKRKIIAAVLLIAAVVAAVVAINWRDISFYLRDPSETERAVKAYADANGARFRDYPESLIDLLERNPETEEFVLRYPFREELPREQITVEDGVPLLMQWDPRWGYQKYGSDVLGITGCGPTCLAMAGYYVTGDESFNPAELAAFAQKNGYYSEGNGSSWTLISEGGVKLGLQVKEIPLVKKKIMDHLEAGNPIICIMGPGDFTDDGQFVVLTEAEEDMVKVLTPNSRTLSENLWSFAQIESQIQNLWVCKRAET